MLTPVGRERLAHLGRATVLDWVIDPLSDWLDAGSAPEHQEIVRAEKERIHKRAFACYEELYGRPATAKPPQLTWKARSRPGSHPDAG